MLLKKIHLRNFRSYHKRDFPFSPLLTVIIGPNAIGKTNLLESIYLLSTGKSFRAETEGEMIGYGSEMSNVKCQISNEKDEKTNLEVILTVGEVMGQGAPAKKFLVDGVSRRMVDFVGNLKAVIFWPQDLELITSSPSRRRKYLDSVLSQVDREYRRTLASYERGVRSRNKLLERIREGKARNNELFFWDQLLITHGGYLTKKREEFLNFVNDQKKEIDGAVMEVLYDHSYISQARLDQYAEAEIASATTLVGPHRDDFAITVGGDKGEKRNRGEKGRNLHSFGSRGEQRLAVLWLKLSELEFIKTKTGERPILLLDDIFSELDHEHRNYVLETIPKQQTIITATDIHLIEGATEKAQIITLNP